MKKTARIIVTLACDKSCEYCANKILNVKEIAIPIKSAFDIPPHEEYVITGGNPLLYPELDSFLDDLINSKRKESAIFSDLYIYLSRFNAWAADLLEEYSFNGLTYTLHKNTSTNELIEFQDFQDWLKYTKLHNIMDMIQQNCRLTIHPEQYYGIPIDLSLWSKIETPFKMDETTCYLPENEDLYILES